MKKWRIVFYISFLLFIAFFLFVIFNFFHSYSNIKYPYEFLGATVFNSWQYFLIYMSLYLGVFGVPIILDVILIVVSFLKLRKII